MHGSIAFFKSKWEICDFYLYWPKSMYKKYNNIDKIKCSYSRTSKVVSAYIVYTRLIEKHLDVCQWIFYSYSMGYWCNVFEWNINNWNSKEYWKIDGTVYFRWDWLVVWSWKTIAVELYINTALHQNLCDRVIWKEKARKYCMKAVNGIDRIY